MVDVSSSIGDWYEYRRTFSPHEMKRNYDLQPLYDILNFTNVIDDVKKENEQASVDVSC